MSTDLFIFFFFKQKTAYEISTRDWSSDVCSSDLEHDGEQRDVRHVEPHEPDVVEQRRIVVDADEVVRRRQAAPARHRHAEVPAQKAVDEHRERDQGRQDQQQSRAPGAQPSHHRAHCYFVVAYALPTAAANPAESPLVTKMPSAVSISELSALLATTPCVSEPTILVAGSCQSLSAVAR